MATPMVLEMVDCPVCGAYSYSLNTRYLVKLAGERHHLCSAECRQRFCKTHDLEPLQDKRPLGGLWQRVSGLARQSLGSGSLNCQPHK